MRAASEGYPVSANAGTLSCRPPSSRIFAHERVPVHARHRNVAHQHVGRLVLERLASASVPQPTATTFAPQSASIAATSPRIGSLYVRECLYSY